MAGAHSWSVEHHTGSALRFHERALPDPARRSVWWFAIDRPALVLGSAQPDDVVNAAAVATMGLDVVRRHSGGGAVLLTPGDVTWVDLIIPAGDPLWQDDVGHAFDWLGTAWVAALSTLGVEGPRAHLGPMVRTEWSGLMCFAGLGRGEVTVGARKVLGIAQRRTRQGARFQCALLHRWKPDALLDALQLSAPERARASAAVRDVAAGIPAAIRATSPATSRATSQVPGNTSDGASRLEAAFLQHLPV